MQGMDAGRRAGARRGLAALLAAVALAAAAGAAAAPAQAQAGPTYVVGTTEDPAAPGGCAAGGPCSLRQALAAAGVTGGTVRLPAGAYRLTEGQLVVGAPPGAPVAVAGAGADATTIEQTTPGARVLRVDAGGPIELSGVTITGGRAHGRAGRDGEDVPSGTAGDGEPGGVGEGGGILNRGELLVADAVISGNEARGGAGGRGGTSDGGARIPGAAGAGGAARGGGIASHGPLRLLRTDVASNAAVGGTGGAADETGLGRAGDGGAAHGGGVASTAPLTVVDATVRESRATGGSAGAGVLAPGSAGDAAGGGIAQLAGALEVRGTTIAENAAAGAPAGFGATPAPGGRARGGGLDAAAAFSLVRSTVAANEAADGLALATPVGGTGGGVHATAAGTIAATTVAGNRAGVAGALPSAGRGGSLAADGGGALSLRSSIVAGGSGAPGAEGCAGAVTSLGGNVGDATAATCALAAPADRVGVDPGLAPLAARGGPTPTLGLAPGSPARGAGLCPAADADQRGYPRPAGAPCDAGAFEAGPPIAGAPSATDVRDGGGSLRGTVAWTVGGGATVRFGYAPAAGGDVTWLPERAAPETDAPVEVSEALPGLAAATTYRVVLEVRGAEGATTAEGQLTTPPPIVLDPPADPSPSEPVRRAPHGGHGGPRAVVLTRLALSPRAFAVHRVRRVGSRRRATGGATLRFALSRAARVDGLLEQLLPGRRAGRRCVAPGRGTLPARSRCTRTVARGRLAMRGEAGENAMLLTGFVGTRALAPGGYRLTATAGRGAVRSEPATVAFTVRRG